MKNRTKYLLGILAAIVGITVLWWAFSPTSKPPVASTHSEEEGHKDEVEEEHGHAHGEGEGEDGHEDEHGHGEEEAGHEEGVLEIQDSALVESGASLDTVRSRNMAVCLPLLGRIVLNEDRAVHVHPRFPGVILEVRKQLGSRVKKGEVLAVIESNENLEPYSVISRMDGTVVGRHASVGESVSADDEILTVADLSTVWVDFQVYRQDFAKLRSGQRVRVSADGIPSVEVRLAYLSPSTDTYSQSLLARAELPNPKGIWTPGLFVGGEAAVEEFLAPSVRIEAVQKLAELGAVVFVRESENRYVPMPVRLGRRDGEFVELLEGPKPGAAYVSKNSFVLKAELGKGEASHDH